MFSLPPNRPALMGILNVTPDSFSDGGRFLDPEAAVERGITMAEEGADLVDVGGESTRPGSEPVPLDEELRRVVPVIEALAARGVPLSVDTCKPEVARRALAAGASVVNDVTALSHPEMATVCAESECSVCLMHMKGEPRTMQVSPEYGNVVAEVRDFLLRRAKGAEAAGIASERLWIDPGIGFGKTVQHNLELLHRLHRFVESGYPVLIGVSRKSFLGAVLGGTGNPLPVNERQEATLAAQTIAQMKGARIIRAHEVRAARRVIEVVSAILHASDPSDPSDTDRR
jgi:dihydropteroate synthase